MRNEVIAKKKSLPVLSKRAVASDHVNVVRAAAVPVAPDEERIPWWKIVAEARAPEVVVALRLQNRCNLRASSAETGDLHQNVHNGLGSETGNGCAAKMFDATDKPRREAGAQTVGFLTEKFRPARVVANNGDILTHGTAHLLSQGAHFK